MLRVRTELLPAAFVAAAPVAAARTISTDARPTGAVRHVNNGAQ